VITAGTFLRGRIHVGVDTAVPGGRAGDPPSVELAQALVAQGFTVLRFKTGTPPRIDGRTVDFVALDRQDGDPGPYWFSFHERARHPDQVPCWLTYTGPQLRMIVEARLSESAMYGGAISARGPRYCPSIEDKVLRFPHAERHQVFLEPEGLGTSEMYVNGLSTSLPPAVQLEMLRTMPGLSAVEMTRPGYAIEYDYLPPTQLRPTLESKAVCALFFAGQVNGTTGYEEAAGQGFVAGVNAAAAALDQAPLILGRDQAVIGTLVDDLVTRAEGARECAREQEVERGHALAERDLVGVAGQEPACGGAGALDQLHRADARPVRRADVRVVLAEVARDRVDHLVRALRPARPVEERELAVERGETGADGVDVEQRGAHAISSPLTVQR